MKRVAVGMAIWLAGSTLAWASTRTITVNGTVDDPQASVTINGAAAIRSGGNFSASVTLNEGNNTIAATATDPAGNSASASVTVALDTVPPVITITFPTDGQLLGAQ